MNQKPDQLQRKPGLLVKPTYGYAGPSPMRPSLREVLVEWIYAISFWNDATRLLPALNAAYHVATFAVFIYFLTWFFDKWEF